MIQNLEKVSDDLWVYKINNTYAEEISFRFDFLPNNWFKATYKQFIIDILTLKNISASTLYRYHYSSEHFFIFIKENNLTVTKFENLTYEIVQQFLFYLKQSELSKTTQSVVISALKKTINHGISFGYEGYPSIEIFDGNEWAKIGIEDTLKTKNINDETMKRIEEGLKREKNIFTKSIIEIIIDTGIRLGELLDLRTDYLSEDFSGKPILKVKSSKTKSERYIPISARAYRAIKKMLNYTEPYRKSNEEGYIFIYDLSGSEEKRIRQVSARYMLSRFLNANKISDKISFHSFRHTLGTDMLNNGMTIFEIQDYLGHESTHSTALYARVKSPKVQSQYKKVGFIGLIQKDKKEIIKSKAHSINPKDIKSAALPDGYCGKPIDNQGNLCAKFNACIICPKFITTPEHLPVHKNHLERLRLDREEYMKTEYIGTQEHLEKIEYALETIIGRLEEMQNGSQEAGRL